MKLILNEQYIINEALKNGYIDKRKPSNTIKLLIKYYYNIGQDKDQVRKSIEDFMKENYENFNTVKWCKTLDKMVDYAKDKNNELFVLDEIIITKTELDIINNINNNRLENLAFVLLVYAKIYNKMNGNDSNWVNAELKDIFSDTKMAVKLIDQGKMIYKLKELNLVDISKKVDCTNIKVLFVDENGEKTIIIKDFRNFIYEYLKYNGEKIGKCEECNTLIKLKNKTKYCKECAKDIKRQQDRIADKKYKEKLKSEKIENSLNKHE